MVDTNKDLSDNSKKFLKIIKIPENNDVDKKDLSDNSKK